MKLRQSLTFKCISLVTLFVFTFTFINSSAYAEALCWNDGYIAYAYGGLDIPSGIARSNPNPTGSEKVADPVNLATGNYYYEHLDLNIPARGLPLEFKRFYNSQDDYDGPFGIGWSHGYNIFLIETTDGGISYVIRRNPDGNKDKFSKNPDESYSAPSGIFDSLTKTIQGYVITTKQGIVYQFNASGYLASVTDRNNNIITLTYDANTGVLTKIADTLGREVILEYTAERKIAKITDFSSRSWNYAYQNGDLISVTQPATPDYPRGTTTTYAYNEHNLVSITDAKGQTFLSVVYDSQDRVDTLTSGADTYDFSYAQQLTSLYEPKGNRIDYQLNDDGTINKKIEYASSANYQTSYTYNADKLITKIVYPKGNTTEYRYDSKGNLLEFRRKPRTDSNESDVVTLFSYEARFNFIKTLTEPKGFTTTYYYDYEESSLGDLNGDGLTSQSTGNLVKIVYPQVNNQAPESKFTYNTYGQLETLTEPNGNITKYEYELNTGYLSKFINGLNSLNLATEMTYDLVGNVTSIKDPKLNTTTFEYDSHNNLTKTISAAPFHYITTYKYDANDNLIQIDRETRDSQNLWQSTYYTYDVLDRLATIKDELDNTTTFTYDANGNRDFIKDAELNSTTYTYDERNLLWKVTGALNNITEHTYDANGNLEKIQDAKGNLTTYTYDDFDRLIKTTYANNSFETYTYDVNSNLINKTDPKGQITTYTYDALNRLDLKTYPDNSTVDYAYDLGSRLFSVTDTTGTINYTYNSLNRITQVAYPGNKSLVYEYDANSNRTKLTYPDASFITYEYDELNRLSAIKDASATSIASFTYDSLSRRTQLDLANSNQTLYEYDAINRLTSINQGLSPQGTVPEFSYTYDKVGNRKTLTDLSGTHTYTYDKLYQLTQADYPLGYPFVDTTFSYDAVGNRTNYTTNSLNQYTQLGTTNYTYDLNGNLTSDGNSTYTYDYENRLIEGTVPDRGLSLTYKYDAFGRRIQQANQQTGQQANYIYDGDQVIAEYDGSGNLTTKYIYGPGIDEPIKGLSPQGTVPEWFYHFDGLGSVTSLTNQTGSTSETYTYDVFGKPNPTSNLGNRFMFTGREYDSEIGLYYYRARYYSPSLGRFLQRDPIGYWDSLNLYQYCLNNPISSIDPFGLWVAIGERAIGPGSHTVIILHPDNPSDFANDTSIRWYRNEKGELEATLSANPNWRPNLNSAYGNLTAYPSNKSDRPSNLRNIQRITDPLNRSDSQLIRDIINSANKYRNNLPYHPIPTNLDNLYNSNSYTRGILKDAGIPNPPNLPEWQPGWDKPIPLKKK